MPQKFIIISAQLFGSRNDERDIYICKKYKISE